MDFKNIRTRRLVKIEDADTLVLDFLLADGPFKDAFQKSYSFELADQVITLADPQTLIDLKKGRMSNKDRSDIEGLEKLLRGDL